MRRNLVLLLAPIILIVTSVQSAHAQQEENLTVNNPVVSYQFGESILFQAQIVMPNTSGEVYLLLHADDGDTQVIPVHPDTSGNISETYAVNQGIIPPFSTIYYRYRINLQNGQELQSPEFTFTYTDNLFTQEISAGEITVHWYNGDLAFGQTVLNVSQRSLQHIQELLTLSKINPIHIYIYATNAEQTRALGSGQPNSSGGHANLKLRIAFAVIAPGAEQGLEMDQKIPHELAHILMYDMLGERYFKLPIWLSEGTAARMELSTNPDYSTALRLAESNSTIIPISALCGSFPLESEKSLLAYAESESFTKYLINKFGQSGFITLSNAYGDGLDCNQGMQTAFGQPLTQVEADWLATFKTEKPTTVPTLTNPTISTTISPYIIVIILLMVVSIGSAFLVKRP